MNALATAAPPPLERFSADKFRQWLAGMVSEKQPSTQTDRDEMKAALVRFLAVLPMVYGLKDRMPLWEKIGNAAAAALETCNGDLMQWANETMAALDPNPGRVASCEELHACIADMSARPDWWQAECLRVMKELRLVLPSMAKKAWNDHQKATGTEYKGSRNGDE